MNKNDLVALLTVGVFGAVNVGGWMISDDFARRCIRVIEDVRGRQIFQEYLSSNQ